jgi:hypothetical protein
MDPGPAKCQARGASKDLMFDVIEILLTMALNIALPAWLVRRDERRLPELELSRAWNPASYWIAVVAFGPLCLPVHYVRTRRSVRGFFLGILACAAVFAVQIALGALLGAIWPE